MSLVEEYKKQFFWRDWSTALSKCPISQGQRVLDLGCGPGDLSYELVQRGARVTGIDANDELLAAAKERCPTGEFQNQDLDSLNLPLKSFDGLWCSFTAAYFTDFHRVFSDWTKFLKEEAWVCVAEIDDLLGHRPLSEKTQHLTQVFYEDSLTNGRYDFKAGSKIRGTLETTGFRVTEFELQDAELSFLGPASDDVREAWINRFNRMTGLKTFLKGEHGPYTEEFLQNISTRHHRSLCRVICCIGTRP